MTLHRDIKPSNLFLLRDGTVKILDLGIVKRVGIVDDRSRTREPGVDCPSGFGLVGSPEFMTPEQFRGANADVRSDIYSLGQTFACLLTGQVQAGGSVPIPSNLKPILARMTAGLPEQRYQTAEELIRALDAATKNSYIKLWAVAFLVAILLTLGFMMLPSAKTPVVEPSHTPPTVESPQPSAPEITETKIGTLVAPPPAANDSGSHEHLRTEPMEAPEQTEKLRRMSENKKTSDRFKREMSEYKEAMTEWNKTGEGERPVMPEIPDILPPVD